MIRLIAYLVLIILAAAGLSWIADRPGSINIEWLGYDIRTSVFIGTIVLLITFAALVLAGWLGILAFLGPKRIGRRLEQRRNRVGLEAVRKGIFAAGAGDKATALKAGAIAKRTIPEEPLALLLEAQSAQLSEDPIASRQAFERMLDKPGMVELGLRGLYLEAKKAGQSEAAKQFAERALTANTALSWSSSALFEMQCREGDWRAALETLQIARQNRHLGKAEADKRRALLLTQRAIETEDSEPSKALAYAMEAFDLAPSLIPAAAVAGRILTAQGQISKATRILTQAWRTTQHPEIALIFAHARRGDSPRDRLARVNALVAAGSAGVEGAIAIASAAIETKDWTAARLALEPHLSNTPPARVCRLMARIEAGQNRDAGRAREWLARAARGAPDPVWTAPDGSVSSQWQPMSPATGALGILEWKTPPAAPPGKSADDFIAEMSALDVIDSEPVPSNIIPPIEADAGSDAGSQEIVTATPEDKASQPDAVPKTAPA